MISSYFRSVKRNYVISNYIIFINFYSDRPMSMACIRLLFMIWSQNVFMIKALKIGITTFENYRGSLLRNKSTIEVEDLGAGSKKLQHKQRQISQIAKNAGISKKRAKLLGRLSAYFGCVNILEIGTSLGIATASLALANPKSKIITLEGCKNTAKVAKDSFKKFDLTQY